MNWYAGPVARYTTSGPYWAITIAMSWSSDWSRDFEELGPVLRLSGTGALLRSSNNMIGQLRSGEEAD